MEKTIKYLENGEYHYATVRSVGDLAQLKTTSKETLVEAINELWNGGGNADPSKAPKPEGYDQLVQDVADAVKNQQEISQQWIEWQNEEAQLTEERKQAYLQAMKEMQEAIHKAKADAAALDDKTAKLDEQITKTFSDLDTSIQNMHEQLQKEADRMNKDLQDTKGSLTTLRTDLQNTQMDNGKIHDELTNINGKFEHKVWQTDLDPLKEQIDRAETSVQQTKDELLGKASRQDLDTVSNTVSKLDTQLKETAKGVEISVKKDELGGEIAEALTNKTNILLGTRRFTTNNWTQRDHVEICSDPWKGFLVAKQNSPIEGIQQAYEVKSGTTYTFSLFAKMDNLDDSNKPQIILAKNNLDTSLDTKIDVWRKEIDDITSDFKRYDLTFTPSEDCTIYPHVISNSNNPIFVCGYQLEIGKTSTPWEPNQEDVGDYVEKAEAQFNVYNDKIQALTEKQRQQGDTQEKLRTEVTQTAEGIKQVSESLKDTNGDITKLRGDLERTADHMKSEYETYTNKAVGQISDSTLNLIRNSSFQNKDEDFAQWQNISAKANVRQDENGLRWVELTQSGMTADNIVGLTSNYFNIKQGKVTIAVDIKSGAKADLDIESVLTLELYDENKKRVDFTRLTLNDLGLNKSLLGDHQVHRGLYRLGIDRNDAKYMTVKALLVRNGDLYFTNFSARLSSIDDGAYEPNPDDINQQILKQNTKIEQNAKEVAIKANSVDVTRDIKSAVDGIKVGGANLVAGTNQEYTMGYGIPNTIWKDGNAYATLPTSGSGGEILPQDPHTFGYTLTPGREYTQTIWFQTDASIEDLNAAKITWFTGAGHDWQNAKILNLGSNSYKIFSTYIWPGKIENSVRLFDIINLSSAFNLRTGTYLKFGKLKLEEGNKSTSWSPAPEDTSAEIKSAKDAAIKVASDQINIHVNELSTSFDDKLNKRINEAKTASEKFTSDGIEQTVTKITDVKNDVDRLGDKVDGISVGGTNLAFNTDTSYSGKNGQYGSIGGMTVSRINELLGQTITISVDVEWEGWKKDGSLPQNRIGWELQLNYKDGSASDYPGAWFNPTTADGKRRIAATYTLRQKEVASLGENFAYIQINCTNAKVSHLKIEKGNKSTDWSPAPEDVNKKIDTQTLDSANINDLKTQGHYFVKNLTGNPIGGWVYVDVTGNNNDRVRQDIYADQNNQHKYRSWNGSRWSDWEQGAYLSDVKTEVTASVKNLGDRVTTEVNSITTRQNNFENDSKMQHSNDTELVRKSDFEDGSKGNWTVTGVVSATNPAPPAELGQSGMKVLQTNSRDGYEDGIWYSVKPGEKFDVDYWCASSTAFYTTFGLNFVDKNKENNNWQGVSSDQSGQWKHYTGTITAPANASFARPWFQMEKPADNTTNSSWIAKPHIRRQNPATIEAIREVNTKWDVANGQIQGKVTATDVNNILNGKGYATQSWAQTMFTMKSDAITLQAVRDNITNGIQNQVNDTRNILNNLQVGGRNYLRNSDKSISGWAQDLGTMPSEVLNSLAGKTITISVDVEWNDFKSDSNKQNRLGFELAASGSDGRSYWLGAWKSPTTASGKERISTQYSLPAGVTFTVNNNGANGYVSINGIGKVSHAKIEIGNKATDWTPAPEDVDQQITNTNKKIDTRVLNSANVDDLKAPGHYFVHNLTNSPITGWVYVDVAGGTDRLKQDVYQDSGYEHKSRRWFGSSWTEWTTDVNNKNVVSQINITPDQIKIASNKIVIDGNTDIHGDLRTDRVRLVGKNGAIDMTGDTGIKMTNNDGSSMLLGRGNIDLTYKNDFRMNIDSSLMTIMQRNQFTNQNKPIAILNIGSSWNHSYNQIRGADIRYNPGNVNDVNLHGADYLALSYNKPNLVPGEANIKPQLVMAYQDLKFDENHYLWRKGVNVADDLTIQEYQRINVGYRDKEDQSGKWTNDPLMIHRMQWGASSQADRYQPTIRLGYSKDSMGSAGVTFLWNQVKPFGNRDISDLGEIWFNGIKFIFGWVNNPDMMGNQWQPSFYRVGEDGSITSGIAFAPGSTWDLGSNQAHNITAKLMWG